MHAPESNAAPLLRRLDDSMAFLNAWLGKLPYTLLALLGRFSIAAVFWHSAQTKVQGFALDIITGQVQLGWPRLADSAIDLFRDEYRLPLVSPHIAAPLAALSEHLFSTLILIGLATRFSAAALLVMTLVIEIFVYPDAYPTHGVWATVLLLLISRGPGKVSLDHWIQRWAGRRIGPRAATIQSKLAR